MIFDDRNILKPKCKTKLWKCKIYLNSEWWSNSQLKLQGTNIKETFWFENFSGLVILRFSYTVGLIKAIINNRYCQFDWITFYSRTIPKILWLRLNLATAQCGWGSTWLRLNLAEADQRCLMTRDLFSLWNFWIKVQVNLMLEDTFNETFFYFVQGAAQLHCCHLTTRSKKPSMKNIFRWLVEIATIFWKVLETCKWYFLNLWMQGEWWGHSNSTYCNQHFALTAVDGAKHHSHDRLHPRPTLWNVHSI